MEYIVQTSPPMTSPMVLDQFTVQAQFENPDPGVICTYNEIYDNGFTDTQVQATIGQALQVIFPNFQDYYGQLFGDTSYCSTTTIVFTASDGS